MSEKFYHESDPASALRSWVMWQMLRGMGYGALFVLTLAVILGGLWGIGQILPEESKQAPSPYSQLNSPLIEAEQLA